MVGNLKSNQEIEVKLEIVDKQQLEVLHRYLQSLIEDKNKHKLQRIVMKAIYYDTEDGFYRDNKIAYRVRQENDCFVATYKEGKINTEGVFERIEVNKIVDSLEPDISVFAGEQIVWNKIKESKTKKFIPMIITDFVRVCIVIPWRKSLIEIALDEGFVQGGKHKAPICEVELELKSGNIEDLLSLKENLIEKFSLKISLISKYKRGLLLCSHLLKS